MRDSIVFYRGFYEAIKDFPAEEQVKAFHAIMEYGLNGKEIEVDGLAKAVFTLAKPQIDKNNKRYENGKLGGRKPNQGETKPEPKSNQDETEHKPSDNQIGTKPEPNVNVNDNANVNDNDIKNTTREANALFERLWKLYPCKKGKGQVSDSKKRQLLAIGETTLVKAIERYSLGLEKEAWRKPQNGSTFFNSGYVDYLDDNYMPEPEKPKKSEKPKNKFTNYPQRKYDFSTLEEQLLRKGMES